MPKGVAQNHYTGEFKEQVIKHMIENKLSYSETMKLFEIPSKSVITSGNGST